MCELVTIAAEKDMHTLYLDVYRTVGLFKSSDNWPAPPGGNVRKMRRRNKKRLTGWWDLENYLGSFAVLGADTGALSSSSTSFVVPLFRTLPPLVVENIEAGWLPINVVPAALSANFSSSAVIGSGELRRVSSFSTADLVKSWGLSSSSDWTVYTASKYALFVRIVNYSWHLIARALKTSQLIPPISIHLTLDHEGRSSPITIKLTNSLFDMLPMLLRTEE